MVYCSPEPLENLHFNPREGMNVFSLLHINRDSKKMKEIELLTFLMEPEDHMDNLSGNSIGHMCESISGLFC